MPKIEQPEQEGTSRVKRNKGRRRVDVSADGTGIVSHAGVLLRELAEQAGLTAGWTAALIDTYRDRPTHAPGQVLVDLAVTIADGRDALRHLGVLRDQQPLFGPVASDATAWRVLDRVDERRLATLRAARAAARARVWAAGGGPDLSRENVLVRRHHHRRAQRQGRRDADLEAHLRVSSAVVLPGPTGAVRRGGAGRAAAPRPRRLEHRRRPHRRARPGAGRVARARPAPPRRPGRPALAGPRGQRRRHPRLPRRAARARYPVLGRVRRQCRRPRGHPRILALPEPVWQPAVDTDGTTRDGASVAEISGLVNLSGWPAGARLIVRRERPHPGAQYNLFDPNGYRHTAFLTDTPGRGNDIAALELRHRQHARVEDRIRCGKATGLRNLPCRGWHENAAWVYLALTAADLLTWAQALCFDGELRRVEPATLRHRVLHTAGRLIRSGRRRRLRLSRDGPWSRQLAAAFGRLRAAPWPT